jgi:beta-glucosidase
MSDATFPDGFMWGTASAGYMTEGNSKNSDWYDAEMEDLKNPPDKRVFAEPCGLAVDFWNRYEEDYELAKEIGVQVHRMSIEWARVFPEQDRPDEAAIERYGMMLDALRSRGIQTMLTLHHFVIPSWVAAFGGFLNRNTFMQHYRRYVELIVKRLGDKVDWWLPINEPSIVPLAGHLLAINPPFRQSFTDFGKSFITMMDMHASSYRIIKDHFPDAPVGVAYVYSAYKPDRENSRADKFGAWFSDWSLNKLFFKGIETGRAYPSIALWKKIEHLKGSLDFIGFNFYSKWYVRGLGQGEPRPDDKLSDRGYILYPEGMYEGLTYYGRKFDIPIIVTENGTDTTDESARIDYIDSHLRQILRAINDGIDIRGYMYWSLTDNWEWTYGFKSRFGLIHVDYETQERAIKEGGRWYADVIRNNAL